MGRRNIIGPHVYIGPSVELGDDNRIDGYASIGMPAEHRNFFDKLGPIKIGNKNVIREFTTINAATFWETRMGHNCIMLRGSHLSHDSVLEDMVTVSCNALIGGESHIMEGANLALGCILHQRSVIGSYSMVGMGAVVTKTCQVSPGTVWVGNPAKFMKNNDVGLHRARIDSAHLIQEIERYEKIRRKRS